MATNNAYRVLGIDPGLHITGYAAIEFARGEPVILEAGTIRTPVVADMSQRIEQIHLDLAQLIADIHPDLVAIEQIYAHYKHPRTAILMAHARGVILLTAQLAGVPIKNMPATHVKKSLTGNGHASKQQVQRSIQAVCKLKELPEPPDVADAIAIAICAGRHALR